MRISVVVLLLGVAVLPTQALLSIPTTLPLIPLPTKPYLPVEPTEPVKPTEPNPPVESTEPNPPVEPTEPNPPVQPTVPCASCKPDTPCQSFDDDEKRDLVFGQIMSDLGFKVLCLLQHCQAEKMHAIMERSADRSRRKVAENPNATVNQIMDISVVKMAVTSFDVGCEVPCCSRVPFQCVANPKCDICPEDMELATVLGEIYSLMECIYNTRDKVAIEKTRAIAARAAVEIGTSKKGVESGATVIRKAVKKAVTDARALNAECAKVKMPQNYCRRDGPCRC